MNLLLIPARYGSSRFPGKPLSLIAGKPMVWWVYEAVRGCSGFDCIAVVTDSYKIHDVCFRAGVESFIAGENARNGTERLIAFAQIMQLRESDIIINVQGDEPMMRADIPQRLLFNVMNKPDKVWTAIRPLRKGEKRDRDVVKCEVDNGEIYGWWRDWSPGLDWVQIGVYGYTVGKLREYMAKDPAEDELEQGLEQLRWGEPLACFTTHYDGIGVDRPEHIALVEERLKGHVAV